MKNKIWMGVVAVVVILLLGGVFLLKMHVQPAYQSNTPPPATFDPLNATYTLDGQPVTLVNGKAETPVAPGSATKSTTTIFGQPILGDLNGDGKLDAAVILVQNPGGSGTFYYIAAAINTADVAEGTNAVLLGDRIAPQTTAIKNGQIIENYADRKPGEPMTAAPSVGVTKYLTYEGSTLKTSAPISGAGEHCGGNMTTAATCMAGYHCAPTPGSHLPFGDVGGT